MASIVHATATSVMAASQWGAITGLAFDVDKDVGGRALNEHDRWPRVIWVPTIEDWRPDKVLADSSPREITRIARTVDVYLWGEDLEGVEALESALIESLFDTLTGQYELRQGRWLTQEEAAWLKDGECLRLPVMLFIPVTASPATTVVVTSLGQEGVMVLSSEESGCSNP